MSRLLLDSHIFYWYDVGNPRLRAKVVAQINACEHVFVSAASIWELTIKRIAGKLPVDGSLEQIAISHDFKVIAVSAAHAEAVLTLERHHRDPFDHLLLAQAKVEGMTLVTHDQALLQYDIPILLV